MSKGELKEIGRGSLIDEIALPDGVTASVSGRVLALKGPNGEASREISGSNVAVSVESGKVVIASARGSKREKKMAGSVRAHIVNMVRGVTEGHVYKLKICFTHFPITATVSGRKFVVKNFLGEKTPRELELPEGVKAKVEGADVIMESASKESVGRAAASVEQLTKRSNYDTRVFADGIYITVKDGKEVK
ncbi:50S ribosomal protein L6 [Candidatus Woesearchaeota archaeon]|nr:50S ribosomal protein L6 [Candidatus Woesearchaeota archaeon]